MAIAAFKRYEQKFTLNQAQFNALIPRLTKEMHSDEHCKKR